MTVHKLVKMQKITLIRTNGTEEQHEIPADDPFDAIEQLLEAQYVCHINLRDGRTMWMGLDKPCNMKAQTLFNTMGNPADMSNIQRIVGDVCVTNSEEFGYDIKTGRWGV